MNRLDKPWQVSITVVEGCNRMCDFCGIHGIRDKVGNYKYMSLDTLRRIADEIAIFCPTVKIDMASHGEPTLHPDIYQYISIAREKLPKAQMMLTTNGLTSLKSSEHFSTQVKNILNAGIDFILMDTYYPERDRIRAYASEVQGVDVVDYYTDLLPAGLSPYYNYHRKKLTNTLILLDDISKVTGKSNTRLLNNAGGNSGSVKPLSEPLKSVCVRPFREMSFRHDGNVTLCCQDWKGEYVIGNIMEYSMSDIWNSDQFYSVRTFLRNKLRVFNPCSICDMPAGFRVGLLPAYPYPTSSHANVVKVTLEKSKEYSGVEPRFTSEFEEILHGE
jgi:radical SAM protein with 4Fe4S-binding SPASM domain